VRYLLSFILIISRLNSFGQNWTFDNNENGLPCLNNMHYSNFNDCMKGIDSAYYLFTDHKPEAYWKKKNNDKEDLLVSRIDSLGNISVIRKLDTHVERVYKVIFNNKYYLLSMQLKEISGKSYYQGYIYNSKWQNESVFLIQSLNKNDQGGYSKFVVDKDENFFLFTNGTFIDHRPQDFTGAYLIKCNKAGQILKLEFYPKSEICNINLIDTTLFVRVLKKKYEYPFYLTDSIFNIEYDLGLAQTKTKSEKNVISEGSIHLTSSTTNLKSECKIVLYDSSVSLSPSETKYIYKVALRTLDNKNIWNFQIPFGSNYSTPRALSNGNFITEMKKWNTNAVNKWNTSISLYDTTCFVEFNKKGDQKTLKEFLNETKPGGIRRKILYYFEGKTNEIWVFYQKTEDLSRFSADRIYFMRLFL
jgi:hypothetical protein